MKAGASWEVRGQILGPFPHGVQHFGASLMD